MLCRGHADKKCCVQCVLGTHARQELPSRACRSEEDEQL